MGRVRDSLACVVSDDHVSELEINFIDDLIKVFAGLTFRGQRIQELHVVELVHDIGFESALDETHRDLLVRFGRVGDDAHTVVVEFADALHHAGSLEEGTVVVILGEGVLLEEFILDDLGGLKDGLLILGEGIFTDELDNFDEFVLLLEDFAELGLQSHEFGLDLTVVVFEDAIVGREGQVPVDGREMLSFGQVLV